MNEYKLKNNSVLQDGCILNSWLYQLQKLSGEFANPLERYLPESMFKQEEDRIQASSFLFYHSTKYN